MAKRGDGYGNYSVCDELNARRMASVILTLYQHYTGIILSVLLI